MIGVAVQPVPERVCTAAGLEKESLGSGDFRAVFNLLSLTPGLRDNDDDGGGLRVVRAYYSVIEALKRLAGVRLPLLAAWADREMAVCSRYVAVRVSQRLESNQACAAELWS
jgi:hypothetical protein